MLEQDAINSLVGNVPPMLADFIGSLDFSQSYTDAVADAAIAAGLATSRDKFWRAYGVAKAESAVIARLGAIPRTPRQLIELLLDRCDFRIDPDAGHPLSWMCPLREQRWRFEAGRLDDFAQDINRNLLVKPNRFSDREITAQAAFVAQQFDEQLRRVIIDRLSVPTEFDWETLVKTVMVQTDVRWEVQAAILQKFIWQVKRKLHGLPVTDHIMPVLYGSQAGGKSTFCERLVKPLGRLSASTNMKSATDAREVGLFQKYILFVDEMSKAPSAEIESLKTAITRTDFDYRPMTKNSSVQESSNASFIGTTNKALAQVIQDPTGNRRFFQLDYRGRDLEADARGETAPHFLYLDGVDWWTVWGSVDHNAADPMLPYRAEIAKVQDSTRTHSSVEQFADHVAEHCGFYCHQDTGDMRSLTNRTVSSQELYLAYRAFCDALRLAKPSEKAGFDLEIGRLLAHTVDFPFRRSTTNGARTWRYVGPSGFVAKLVKGGVE